MKRRVPSFESGKIRFEAYTQPHSVDIEFEQIEEAFLIQLNNDHSSQE